MELISVLLISAASVIGMAGYIVTVGNRLNSERVIKRTNTAHYLSISNSVLIRGNN